MKCNIMINDKVEGFDLELRLENLSAIQMSSFYKAFSWYIKHNKDHFALPDKEKELPEIILKEYDREFREAVKISSNMPIN